MPKDLRRSHRALVFTIDACMFVFGIVLFSMGALLPTLQFGNSYTVNLGSVPLIGILIATVFGGPILDMYGAKQMMIGALLLIAGSAILFTQNVLSQNRLGAARTCAPTFMPRMNGRSHHG